MGSYPGTEPNRLAELGGFLRDRRARIRPETVGLPPGFRRRTPGLRREEVAQLAGVGLTWYTWLEQGRDIRVSVDVLCSIARVLQLEPVERSHLFRLAGHPALEGPAVDAVRPALRRVLESWEPYPAIVLGRRWDVLAWNGPYVRVFGDYRDLPEGRRNVMWSMFMRPARRTLMREWEREAALMVASFQTEAASHLDEPEFQDLISELRERCPEFAAMWARHDVRGRLEGVKLLDHPALGPLDLEYTTYRVNDQPGLKLTLYTAEAGSPSDRALLAAAESQDGEREAEGVAAHRA
jgi:transcriptional regulator with XRE-family HTH domain